MKHLPFFLEQNYKSKKINKEIIKISSNIPIELLKRLKITNLNVKSKFQTVKKRGLHIKVRIVNQ